MTVSDQLPPERRLPPRRRDEILRSVLGREESTRSGRHRVRWLAPIAVGAAAALIAAGAIALSDRDTGQPDGAPPAGQPADDAIPLDLGPLTRAEIVGVLPDVDRRHVDMFALPYTRRIDGPPGAADPVVVATYPRGDPSPPENGILVYWPDVTFQYRVPAPTAAQPIRGLEGELPVVDASPDDPPGYWKVAGVYRVAESVDRVEVRVGTPDGSEPWRVAEPHDGYVAWAAWFALADYEPGTELTVEWRAFDTDGDQIDPTLLPDQPYSFTVPGRVERDRRIHPEY